MCCLWIDRKTRKVASSIGASIVVTITRGGGGVMEMVCRGAVKRHSHYILLHPEIRRSPVRARRDGCHGEARRRYVIDPQNSTVFICNRPKVINPASSLTFTFGVEAKLRFSPETSPGNVSSLTSLNCPLIHVSAHQF